ncbi:hypothetical protein GF339_21220 [candidate division KSB3 bacterium]|uniref:PA14 domain-containing protein n=1 Tax=candidate division KSB3 bacterium TaxID=2044937 RepID=A0A9D5JZH4_9BACT|nr:hypothetical protein [candidate division KSB3 bacterium]MBD3327122.1 hypothetical protein [candidate division KSB3 bacterium]
MRPFIPHRKILTRLNMSHLGQGLFLAWLLLTLLGGGAWWVQSTMPHGLSGTYYVNSHWQGEPWKTGVLSTEISHHDGYFSQAREVSRNRFSIDWTGYIEITDTGEYTFFTNSDDGSWLFIDDTLVVDNGGAHGLQERQGTIFLTEGVHRIRIRYFQIGGAAVLKVFWQNAHQPKSPLKIQMVFPSDISNFHRHLYRVGKRLFPIIILGWELCLFVIIAGGFFPWKRRLSPVVLWIFLLSTGLVVLSGRYDWSEPVRIFSLRGYLSSAYMFLFVMPACYYILHLFSVKRLIKVTLTLFLGMWFSLPFRWLGIDHFHYHAVSIPWDHPSVPKPMTNWLIDKGATLLSIPYEIPFFLTILGGGSILFLCQWMISNRRKAGGGNTSDSKQKVYFFLLFLIILGQTWLHLSLRSPNTYVPHFEKPLEKNYWYHVFLFSEGKGAVNADNFAHRELEEYFLGMPGTKTLMYVRRSLMYYLSSQFIYFFNPYYLFLIFNILLWYITILCSFSYAKKWFGKETAFFLGFLIATGTGFIYMVAQPFYYLAAYAIIAIIIWVYDVWIDRVKHDGGSWRFTVLLGVFLGLCSLIYDIFPFYVFIVGYGLLRKVKLWTIMASLVIAGGVYYGFLSLQTDILRMDINQSNIQFLTQSKDHILFLIKHPGFNTIYDRMAGLMGLYVDHLSKVFFVLPVIAAVIGLTFVEGLHARITCFLLILPSVMALAFFYFGNTEIVYIMPRFTYIVYPAIFILASLLFGRLWLTSKAAKILVMGILVGIFLVNNVDVLGYPKLYYRFYWGNEIGYFE